MEITSFWIILAMCLVPVAVAVIAVAVDEYEAKHGGFHQKHV